MQRALDQPMVADAGAARGSAGRRQIAEKVAGVVLQGRPEVTFGFDHNETLEPGPSGTISEPRDLRSPINPPNFDAIVVSVGRLMALS